MQQHKNLYNSSQNFVTVLILKSYFSVKTMRALGVKNTQKKTPPAKSPYSPDAIHFCCRCHKQVTEYGDVIFQRAVVNARTVTALSTPHANNPDPPASADPSLVPSESKFRVVHASRDHATSSALTDGSPSAERPATTDYIASSPPVVWIECENHNCHWVWKRRSPA